MSTARKMAANQKQIAISEFFEKNKHFLGFDSLTRSLITAVKEAVDNSLDACEEARILPDIKVEITKIEGKKDVIELTTEDNGRWNSSKIDRKGVWATSFWFKIPRHSTKPRSTGNWDHWSCNVLAIDHRETNSSHLKNCK